MVTEQDKEPGETLTRKPQTFTLNLKLYASLRAEWVNRAY